MRKLLLTLTVLLACNLLSFAQMPYKVTVRNNNYQALSTGVNVSDTTAWTEDSTFIINIPFDFKIEGVNVKQIILSGASLAVSDTGSSADAFPIISAEIVDRGLSDTDSVSQSPIRYQVDGNMGSRILKIEVANAGFYDELTQSGTTKNYVNIQLWLYEQSNIVELHYGASQINSFSTYFPLGLLTGYIRDINVGTGNMDKFYILKGNNTSPTVDSFSATSPQTGLTSFPTSGTVYRYTPIVPPSTSVGTIALEGMKVYPTHCTNNITIDNAKGIATYQIININGSTLSTGTINIGRNTIDVSHYPSGMYFVTMKRDNQTTTTRIVKM
ncbi:MAG: T9SS type A sorting domain-containing protein [Flavipsychrobacter sp.]